MDALVGTRLWADRISAAWRKSVEAILEVGLLLDKAKTALPHGEFLRMVDTELPFKRSTAQRLMKIAFDERLTNAAHGPHLPPCWRTLYELTKLSDEGFTAKIADGTIRPDMRREDIALANHMARRRADEARVPTVTSIQGKFRCIVADPGWPYEGNGRGTPDYATMTLHQIFAVPIREWAADQCHFYLWVTEAFLDTGLALLPHWGFERKKVIIWHKNKIGMGAYFRPSFEIILFGIRGGLQLRSHSLPDLFEGRVGRHSEKPERFYEIVREASYGPFGEAFQRTPRPDFVNLYATKVPASSIPPGCSVHYRSGGPILFWPRTAGSRIARRSLWPPPPEPANDEPGSLVLGVP